MRVWDTVTGASPVSVAVGADATAAAASRLGPLDEPGSGTERPSERGASSGSRSIGGAAEESFGDLFDRYEQRIFNLVLRMVGDYEEAVDLTSETFAQALRGLPGFRRQSQPYTWLYRIAVNLCKNHFRRNAHRSRFHAFSLDQRREVGGELAGVEIEDRSQEPGRMLETLELQHEVQKAVAALPPDMRAVVVLRDMQGLSYQEMAEVLDCSLEAVKSRLFRARGILRKQLEPFMTQGDPTSGVGD